MDSVMYEFNAITYIVLLNLWIQYMLFMHIYIIMRGDEQGDNGRKLREKWMELNGKSLQS